MRLGEKTSFRKKTICLVFLGYKRALTIKCLLGIEKVEFTVSDLNGSVAIGEEEEKPTKWKKFTVSIFKSLVAIFVYDNVCHKQ